MRLTPNRVAFCLFALLPLASSAQGVASKEPVALPWSRAEVFSSKYSSTNSPKFIPDKASAQFKAQVGKGRMVTNTCGSSDSSTGSGERCDILVRYGGSPSANNNCGISTTDVTVTRRRVSAIRWQLNPTPTVVDNPANPSGTSYEYELVELGRVTSGELLRGIDFVDFDDDPDGTSSTPRVVLEKPLLVDPTKFDWSVRRYLTTPHKAYYYTVLLKRWNASTRTYDLCDPYDPVIVNRGN